MKVGDTFRNIITAIIKGDFLKRLNVDRYFLHVVLVLCFFATAILFSLLIDRRLNREIENEAILERQRAEMTVLEFEMARFTRRTEVEARLKSMGSDVGEPTKPAISIK